MKITELHEQRPAGADRGAQSERWQRWWSRRRCIRAGIALLVVLYVAAWAASALLSGGPTDLDIFFLPAARIALAGHPLQVYQLRYVGIYPNANGPLSLLPLTGAAALAARFGWLNDLVARRALILAIFSVFPLLMSYEAVRAIDRLRGVALRGLPRLFAYALFALSPQNWHSMLFYGHIEQPLMMWLALLSLRLLAARRPGRAGACMGLALLSRSIAVLFMLPLVLALLRQRRWGQASWFVALASAVTALGLLPFWLADRADLLFSLVTFRSALPVAGGSLWGLSIGTPLEGFAQRQDSLVTLAVVLAVSALALAWRRDLTVDSRGMYLVLALAALAFPLFIKTLWPYYFLEPYVFVGVWWLAGRARPGWRGQLVWWLGLLLPAAVVGCSQLAEAFEPFPYWLPDVRGLSLAISLSIVALCGVLLTLLLRADRHAAAQTAAPDTPAPDTAAASAPALAP